MKEIKFRAWDNKNKKMLESCLFWGEDHLELSGIKYEKWGESDHAEYISELMQYTGLKDINGKDIYESDIVRLKTNYHTGDKPFGWQNVVIFDSGISYKAKNANGDIYNLEEEVEGDGWEVIGNIYENPNYLNQTL